MIQLRNVQRTYAAPEGHNFQVAELQYRYWDSEQEAWTAWEPVPSYTEEEAAAFDAEEVEQEAASTSQQAATGSFGSLNL